MKERKLNRKIGFDYSSEGYYHVVICTKDREMKFGSISNDKMHLNKCGIIANKYIQRIPKHHNAKIDRFQIMPNHIHLLIILEDLSVGAEYYSAPTSAPTDDQYKNSNYGKLSKIIMSLKSIITKHIHNECNDYDFKWQRSYWDSIIKSDDQLYFTRKYIEYNVINWDNDRNNIQIHS